jgi:hypothetical protein
MRDRLKQIGDFNRSKCFHNANETLSLIKRAGFYFPAGLTGRKEIYKPEMSTRPDADCKTRMQCRHAKGLRIVGWY